MSIFWKPTQQPELYHYGVKGMKWKNKKGVTAQTNNAGGGGAIDPNAPAPGSFAAEEAQYAYEQNAFGRAMEKHNQESRPEWQKKWDKSDAKKQLKRIRLTALKKLNEKGVKLPKKKTKAKKKKKSNLKVTFSDGTSKDL